MHASSIEIDRQGFHDFLPYSDYMAVDFCVRWCGSFRTVGKGTCELATETLCWFVQTAVTWPIWRQVWVGHEMGQRPSMWLIVQDREAHVRNSMYHCIRAGRQQTCSVGLSNGHSLTRVQHAARSTGPWASQEICTRCQDFFSSCVVHSETALGIISVAKACIAGNSKHEA
jgi:hypothetical protein